MKTSCSSWSHHRAFETRKIDQMGWLKELADQGFDGVELLADHFPSTETEYLKRIKKTCADLYLSVAMVSAGGHLTVADDERRAAEVREIGRWVDIALFLGAPCVRFFCGSGPELEAGGRALYAKVLEAMREVAALGQKVGITMALENHGNTTAEQLLALHRDVGSDYLKFTLDTGNFPPHSTVHPGTYTSIERCAPHAAIVHAKFFHVNQDGSERDFDWVRIRDILARTGFRGFLSVEYEGPDADEIAVIRRVAGFLRTLR